MGDNSRKRDGSHGNRTCYHDSKRGNTNSPDNKGGVGGSLATSAGQKSPSSKLKRNSWRSKSFSYGQKSGARKSGRSEDNVMKPDYTARRKEDREKMDSLRKSSSYDGSSVGRSEVSLKRSNSMRVKPGAMANQLGGEMRKETDERSLIESVVEQDEEEELRIGEETSRDEEKKTGDGGEESIEDLNNGLCEVWKEGIENGNGLISEVNGENKVIDTTGLIDDASLMSEVMRSDVEMISTQVMSDHQSGFALCRSDSYVIYCPEHDDTRNSMTSPLLLDADEGGAEFGEKPGTLNVLTQTEQVPAGLSAETSLELLKKLSMPALKRELERKKVRFSKNDGKDVLQAKLETVLKLETCPPTCPLTKGKIVIHSEPAELKKRAQQIATMAHNTDTPQVLGEASKQLSQVTQEVRVIRQLLEAHVTHLRAVSDHSTTECGCDMMLENICHSLSHYHVRKLESQLQETLSEINMLQLEKHSLLRAVSRLCNKRGTSPTPTPRSFSATLSRSSPHTGNSPCQIGGVRSQSCQQTCTPCVHGDCRIEYLTSLMTSVLQHHHT